MAWHLRARRILILRSRQSQGHAEELREALQREGKEVQVQIVDERWPQLTLDALRQLTDQDLVDLSGGSRAMAVGAAMAAHMVGARMFFLDDDSNCIIEPPQKKEPLNVHLKVAKVLALNGREILSSEAPQDSINSGLAYYLGSRHEQLAPTLLRIRRAYAQNQRRMRFPRSLLLTHMFEEAQKLNYISAWRQTKRQIILELHSRGSRFFTGEWLEHYVYGRLKRLLDKGLIDDLQMGVMMAWDEAPGANRNELDIAFTKGDRLYILECKSGQMRPAAQMEALNRLVAIRSGLGKFSQVGLVIVDHASRRLERRAKDLDIHLFDEEHLRDLEVKLSASRPHYEST